MNKNKTSKLAIGIAGLLTMAFTSTQVVANTLAADSDDNKKPMNVIFIIADDLGWSDTTLYGNTKLYETPNLERLSKRGMTFNRAYSNSPLCSPTRASILTGQNPTRHGHTNPDHHKKHVQLQPTLHPAKKGPEKAIGVLTSNRLLTSLPTLGKLIQKTGTQTAHFGKWHLGPEPYSPLEHGFDIDIPHHPGPGPAGGYIAPWGYHKFKANYKGEHIEDRMAEEAINWLENVDKDKAFFMNYWQFSVHAPFDAKASLIEKYRKKIDKNSPQQSPTYAAMVHSLDDAVGSLLDAVDKNGMTDNTIIIFISDNGGHMYKKIKQDGNVYATSNYPLRGGKATMYEGGIRVPAIVVWPGVTKPGSRSDEVIQSADFYPTLLNGLGIELPNNHKIDGVDITDALKGGTLARQEIFTYFPHSPHVPDWLPPSVSVHSGDWKLIRLFHGGENGNHDYRLYNLANDIGEQHNLASANPERVKLLDAKIQAHLIDAKTLVPVPNPRFDARKYFPEEIGLTKSQWRALNAKKKK